MQGQRRILGAKSPKAARYREDRLGRLYRAAPRVSRHGSGRLGCGTGARGGHPAACAAGRGGGHGADADAGVAPYPHGVVTGKTAGRKGEGGGKKGLTGGPHMAVREEERWVIAGPAGCVGPQGMVGCGLGELEESFGVV
jgi:hypothetical protein